MILNFLEIGCDQVMPIIRIVRDGVLPIFQWGIPIILIVLGTIDLGKAVIASKEEEIKKAQQMLIKRLIYAVAVFFVVTIVTLVFSLFSTTGEDSNLTDVADSWLDCWDHP